MPLTLSGQPINLRPGVHLRVDYIKGHMPALVFVHGGMGNRWNWRSQFEYAAQQGWTALTYDLGGHGESTPYPRYSIGRHRRDLQRLLQHFEITAPILCCHSYGVPIGLEWAQRYPVQGLVLVAGGVQNLTPWWEFPLVKVLKWSDRRSDIYEAMEIFWGYDFFARRKTDRHAHVPALVITGGRDPAFNVRMGTELAAQFRFNHHLHFPRAGHSIMVEYADAVNQAIAQWVAHWERATR